MEALLSGFAGMDGTGVNVYIALMRYLGPILSVLLLLRCGRSLVTFRREPEIWAWLYLSNGDRLSITHWENVLGRSKRSDIVIDFPTVSARHAVLTRYDDGSWTISDADSKDGVYVNGEQVDIAVLTEEDVIEIGGVEMILKPISAKQEKRLAQLRSHGSGVWANLANLLLLTVLQMLCWMGFVMTGSDESAVPVTLGFAGIAVCQWLLLLFYLSIRRSSFEVETIAFFLCTLGMAVIATVKPAETPKQLVAMVLGLLVFLIVGWSLRDLKWAQRFRYLATAMGLVFLGVTLVFGTEYYGAKNWLVIGSVSIQPSELSKLCFVYAGASTMDRLMRKRNLYLFIAYSVCICGCLALMNDFGTALIFFCAFLIIAFLRSGSVGTIALACTSVGFAGVVALKIAPHALRRFATWRHIWEQPLAGGYQQTRALMCLASGGLFGVGMGQGWLHRVFAADSDVVFATIGEEWGLIMALLPVACLLVLGIFVVRSAVVGRNSFYTIGACTAVGILLLQAIFNVLGTLDVLPLTGVTFPFISNGGTSMIGAWGLLAFVKAADTRQNASFAVALPKRRRRKDEQDR